MTGAGKSSVCDYLRKRYGFSFVRFGQITLDLAKQRFGTVNQEKERIIREEIREKHGMAAYAILNMDKFKLGLKRGNVVGDGLISYEEALFLEKQFGSRFILLCVVAGRLFRYNRLENRAVKGDVKMRFRSHTKQEAISRDMTQLGNINQGPSIALADYYIVNQGSMGELNAQTRAFLEWAKKERGLEL